MKATVDKVIAEIHAKLNTIEEHLAFLIRAEDRFRVGQRVEFSRVAHRKHIPTRKRSLKGVVKKVHGFSIDVHLDGMKKPRGFHHMFFNPVTGQKLF
jgi:predicted trehalose synthase